MKMRTFLLARISRMPTVIASFGMRSILPRAAVTALMVSVSRDKRKTRVGSCANASTSSGSPGSGGSLKARWPVMPTPPKVDVDATETTR